MGFRLFYRAKMVRETKKMKGLWSLMRDPGNEVVEIEDFKL